MVRIGPAGWKYTDWNGIVYPKPKPKGFDELEYISRYFDTVEINTSFYGPPKLPAVQAWLESVKGRNRFRFTAKLYRGYTHTRKVTPEEEKTLRGALDEMAAAGKFGALLLQFPWSFKADDESRTYLFSLLRRLRDYPLVVEVRHTSWITDDVLDHFAELGVGICNIDQPLFHRSVKPAALSTSRVGYVRLHGRNYRQWFSKTADVRERYDYLYSPSELEPWVERARLLEGDATDVYVVSNNHNLGKAVTNSLEILSMYTGKRVPAPPTLLDRYPELSAVTD
jgi:uncharacterized protein YecE (DUF72 family)